MAVYEEVGGAMQKLKVLDLFSGIGGFSLGLERTGGFETVAFCEIEPFCQKVLKKHWPEVPIFEDVRTLNYEGSVDVVCGGFPCQPFSNAGERRGTKDDRHLWPAMLNLVETYRPAWVIGENVAGLTSMELEREAAQVESRINTRYPDHNFYEAIYTQQSTMLLNNLIKDLENIGYAVQPFIIPAVSVDAKHRRDRIWIVANDDSKCSGAPGPGETQKGAAIKVGTASEQPGSLANTKSQQNRGIQQPELLSDTRTGSEDVAHTSSPGLPDGERSQDRQSGEKQELERCSGEGAGLQAMADTTGKRHPRSRELINAGDTAPNKEGQTGQSFDDGFKCEWPAEPSVGRVAHGVSGRVDRLKALGNAVVPQIPEIIGDAILQSLYVPQQPESKDHDRN